MEDTDYFVISEITAEDGISTINSTDVDLVLMDISLPKMDGLEATRQIRKDAEKGNIPIIALTAYAMTTDRESAIEAGCNDFLSKPVDELLLLEVIDRWLP